MPKTVNAEDQTFDLKTDKVVSSIEKSVHAVFSSENTGMIDPYIKDIRKHVESVPRDIGTPESRDVIRSEAYKLSRLKNAIDRLGKEESDRSKQITRLIDANRKHWFDEVDGLQKWLRQPLTEFEENEKRIKQGIDDYISQFSEITKSVYGNHSADVSKMVAQIDELHQNPPEGLEQNEKAKAMVDQIYTMNRDIITNELESARKREAEQQELETLRAEMEKRKREDEINKAKAEAMEQQKAISQRDLEAKDQELREARIEKELAQNERDRIKQEHSEKKRLAEARAADQAHRGSVNGQILSDLQKYAALTEDQSKAVVIAIAKGQVSNVSIHY